MQSCSARCYPVSTQPTPKPRSQSPEGLTVGEPRARARRLSGPAVVKLLAFVDLESSDYRSVCKPSVPFELIRSTVTGNGKPAHAAVLFQLHPIPHPNNTARWQVLAAPDSSARFATPHASPKAPRASVTTLPCHVTSPGDRSRLSSWIRVHLRSRRQAGSNLSLGRPWFPDKVLFYFNLRASVLTVRAANLLKSGSVNAYISSGGSFKCCSRLKTLAQ